MSVKLYHIFPDLMNLYGDYGNLVVLQKALADAGAESEIVKLRPGEAADLADADFLYMGPGTEPARNAALEHLRPLKDALASAILTRQVPALFTGNAWSLLGQTLTLANGETVEGLGLFNYTTAESRDRYTGDAIAAPVNQELPSQPAVGFLNRCDVVHGVEAPLFSLEMGKGNDGNGPAEGFVQGSFYATHLIGPLLVKNPHLLNYIVSLLGVEPAPLDGGSHPALAYQVTLQALRQRLANGH